MQYYVILKDNKIWGEADTLTDIEANILRWDIYPLELRRINKREAARINKSIESYWYYQKYKLKFYPTEYKDL
jgi:hypothetical protein